MQTKLFRPSSAPALEECTKFESADNKDREDTKDGDQFHKDVAAVLKGEKSILDIPKHQSRRDRVQWALGVQRQYVPIITGVEETHDLYDDAEQWVTNGTIDLIGNGHEYDLDGKYDAGPVILDWKRGDYIDHSAQVHTYAVMAMDTLGVTEIAVVTAYYQQEKVYAETITYEQASARVMELIMVLRGQLGPRFHQINEWCGMCRLKTAGCPAWEEHRKALIATPGLAPELAQALDAIKADPEKLGAFLVAKKRFDSLVQAHGLDDEAYRLLDEGQKVPGLKLQSRGYSVVIDRSYKPEPKEGKQ